MDGVGTQPRPTGVREEYTSISSWWFPQPGFQDGDGRFRQRCASLFSTLPNDVEMRARPERDIISCEAGHFRQSESRLDSDEEERVIAPPKPRALIGRREQGFNLWTCEKVDQCPCEPLAGNGQYALDLRGMPWHLKCRVPKK